VQEIKSLRGTIANVSDAGTRVYHAASEFCRYEVMRLMNKGVPASKAYSIVQKQHVESQKSVNAPFLCDIAAAVVCVLLLCVRHCYCCCMWLLYFVSKAISVNISRE